MYDGEEFSRLLKEKLEKRRLEHNRKWKQYTHISVGIQVVQIIQKNKE
jgi:hypothetical protein